MKNSRSLLVLALLFSFAVQAATPEQVRVTTNLGSFVIELQRDRAPLTVENFLGYVRSGHYTNTLFHRVIANFVIQGGGVGTDFKAKPAQKPIPNEAGNGLKNLRGTVGLARASGPHTGDCQFYVNVADNADLDPLPTRWGYAVFGRVVEGMEVIDRISVTPTGPVGPFKGDSPLQPVIIQKIELLTEPTTPAVPAGTAPPAAPGATQGVAPGGETAPAATPAAPPATPPANPPANPPATPPTDAGAAERKQ
jgi:peptidyl-prolyl cis-trans isomerase A (cyclophilin A)/peptidyl-prolyl cis-trans isomerase B (cyclophilin B)